MSGKVGLKNRLIKEGRLLANGLESEMSAKEWLEAYEDLDEEDLIGPQAEILAGYAAEIRARNPELPAGSAEV